MYNGNETASPKRQKAVVRPPFARNYSPFGGGPDPPPPLVPAPALPSLPLPLPSSAAWTNQASTIRCIVPIALRYSMKKIGEPKQYSTGRSFAIGLFMLGRATSS